MKVCVLGAGVVGVATAYYLAQDGHQVTVVDRQPDAASETSFGNAGLISAGDAHAWASPDALRLLVKSLTRRELGISVKPSADPAFIAWMGAFLLECRPSRVRINTLRKLRMALYSRECINEIEAHTGIDYHARKHGIVYFHRTQEGLDTGARHMRVLADNGLKLEVVDRDRLGEIEPALAHARDRIAGAIYAPTDQTGDSAKFARKLATWLAESRSVRFAWRTTVTGLEVEAGRIVRARTDGEPVAADAFVLALGCESVGLARRLGVRLPITPVKGYSITVPIRDESRAPRMGGADEEKLMGYSRLGDSLRVTSSAEFVGLDRAHRPENFRTVLALAEELFGPALDLDGAECWAGLRPMTPTSVPILGPAGPNNLFLNVGHGHLGWTMAAGSGKFVADIMSGRTPEIATDGLTYQ
ncbi:MAG TPA: D-amino acid dehydrogenase [Aestuariivirgaceae bacterium]|nr:D-amino acid dehydrogenase [Aestuariivirgaceae bacterium]